MLQLHILDGLMQYQNQQIFRASGLLFWGQFHFTQIFCGSGFGWFVVLACF